ncbi:MAG TPA: tetratricopeptide repeat protein [Anaeromyxobacteraceae bacterium]|nr:tetratricopeptide repeat protein [Anaeromyxobacteraceae bacterium]
MRPGADDEVEGLDEELLFHLRRGSDLLGRGDAEGARAALERARELRPKDAKVLGLLGQAYHKLNRFDEAADVWHRVVDDNPVEPAARVNYGLSCLKAHRYPEAIKQLEIAVDLAPEHRKAMGYLGLAYLEAGYPAEARGWFIKAGSGHMAARCDEMIAKGEVRRPEAAPRPAPPPPQAAPPPPPAPPPAPEAPVAPVAPVASGAGGLGAWVDSHLVRAAGAETFSVQGDTLVVAVKGVALCRLEGLFAQKGSLQLSLEMKRFRGKATEKPFGGGAGQMRRVSGDGLLLLRAGGRRFTALDLGGESGYFREEAVFGLEQGIGFENGRVPSRLDAELNLVHLKGRGRFLVVSRGEPVTVDVAPDQPVQVPLDALVGWTGNLTPRLALLSDGGGEGPIAVELTGEGRAITDPGAAEEHA